jgi:hypothetical protein
MNLRWIRGDDPHSDFWDLYDGYEHPPGCYVKVTAQGAYPFYANSIGKRTDFETAKLLVEAHYALEIYE